jgi:predicted RNase H-like HicB family nuclease
MIFYPAVFTPDFDEGGFTVAFPDLKGCYTEGNTANEAFEMAQEAMKGYVEMCLENGETLPKPTEPQTIPIPKGGFASFVCINLEKTAAAS